MKVRPGSVVRGAGVALACVTSDSFSRWPILLAGFTGGWFLNKPGLQAVTVVPDADEPWKRATVPFVTSVSSWSAVMLAATTAVRRSRLPAPLAALLLGGGVVVVDSLLADMGEKRDAARAADAEVGAVTGQNPDENNPDENSRDEAAIRD